MSHPKIRALRGAPSRFCHPSCIRTPMTQNPRPSTPPQPQSTNAQTSHPTKRPQFCAIPLVLVESATYHPNDAKLTTSRISAIPANSATNHPARKHHGFCVIQSVPAQSTT